MGDRERDRGGGHGEVDGARLGVFEADPALGVGLIEDEGAQAEGIRSRLVVLGVVALDSLDGLQEVGTLRNRDEARPELEGERPVLIGDGGREGEAAGGVDQRDRGVAGDVLEDVGLHAAPRRDPALEPRPHGARAHPGGLLGGGRNQGGQLAARQREAQHQKEKRSHRRPHSSGVTSPIFREVRALVVTWIRSIQCRV
ncbi:hypothetical protein D3C86_1383180 [compost metagenome]